MKNYDHPIYTTPYGPTSSFSEVGNGRSIEPARTNGRALQTFLTDPAMAVPKELQENVTITQTVIQIESVEIDRASLHRIARPGINLVFVFCVFRGEHINFSQLQLNGLLIRNCRFDGTTAFRDLSVAFSGFEISASHFDKNVSIESSTIAGRLLIGENRFAWLGVAGLSMRDLLMRRCRFADEGVVRAVGGINGGSTDRERCNHATEQRQPPSHMLSTSPWAFLIV